METGCNTYTVRGLARPEAFALLHRTGFRTVELWAGHANYLSLGLAPRRVAAEAARCDLAVRAYCIGSLVGLRPRAIEDRLARAFDFARELGTDLVTVALDRTGVPIADARARRQGVRCALENDWYGELARPRDLAAALAACSPAVGATIDTGHLMFLGCDLVAAARVLAGRTFHVHLKVVRRPSATARLLARLRRRHSMEPALPGCDDGLDGFVSVMRAAGYDGMLAVEHEGEDDLAGALACYRRRAASLVGNGAPRSIAEAAGA